MSPPLTPLALLGNLGPWEILIILVILLILFGGRKLPEFARGLGKSIREFKKATSDVEETVRSSIEDEKKPSESSNVSKSSPKVPDQK